MHMTSRKGGIKKGGAVRLGLLESADGETMT
jgi:hypothetical protein